MHELPITEGILATTLEAAKQARASRITGINLALGVFSGYVSDSIQFYFDLISQGTPAEGAVLQIRRIPVTCSCSDCKQNFIWKEEILPTACPHCGGICFQATGGQEFYVESIEVEEI
ncbi:MAG: hydrogenase maturation nickel metallochaperone HypA [bacterium]